MCDEFDNEFLNVLKSIAESLKIIADKPPVGFTLEMTDGFTKASEQVRDLALAETRNPKVQKFCSFCGAEFFADRDDTGTLCKECKED